MFSWGFENRSGQQTNKLLNKIIIEKLKQDDGIELLGVGRPPQLPGLPGRGG